MPKVLFGSDDQNHSPESMARKTEGKAVSGVDKAVTDQGSNALEGTYPRRQRLEQSRVRKCSVNTLWFGDAMFPIGVLKSSSPAGDAMLAGGRNFQEAGPSWRKEVMMIMPLKVRPGLQFPLSASFIAQVSHFRHMPPPSWCGQ